jgi:hypothetical protein
VKTRKSLSQQDRDHLIEWLAMWTNQSRSFFQRKSDDELVRQYVEELEKWAM